MVSAVEEKQLQVLFDMITQPEWCAKENPQPKGSSWILEEYQITVVTAPNSHLRTTKQH